MRNRRSLEPSWTKRSRSRKRPVVAANTCVILIPLHQQHPRQSASPVPVLKGAPQPLPIVRVAQLHAGRSDTAFGWLTNSTFSSDCRDESSGRRGERIDSAWVRSDSSKFNLLCIATCCRKESPRESFARALRVPQLPLEAPPGHAVPTRRELSVRRVTLTEVVTAGAELRPAKPATKPQRPYFSSGPCAKPPGWSADKLDTSTLGRSHRGTVGKAKLAEAIERTHTLLRLPADYKLGIVPASDTGAMELALWSLLGTRAVTMLTWESFGAGWVSDVANQLKLDADIRTAGYGEIADLSGIDPANDIVFTWNGTTSGVRVPNADWIT